MTTATERKTVWLAKGQDERLDGLVEVGFYLNWAEVIRDGLRRAVRSPLTFNRFDDPLVDHRRGRGSDGRASAGRTRHTFRAPTRLIEEAERIGDGDLAPTVRVAIEIVADDFVEVAA